MKNRDHVPQSLVAPC